MTDTRLPAALSSEALFAKSKAYIRKALLRKEAYDLDEYQLWASLALELLGKSSLADRHPSLIVDPTHQPSLLAACSIALSTDIKTISAKTLFERLRKTIEKFDGTTAAFCDEIALRRNAELHSGDTPFKAMHLAAWESKYWYAASVILDGSGSMLDEWLGTDQAEAPREIVKHAIDAKKQAAQLRIERAAADFMERSPNDRKHAQSFAESRNASSYRNLFGAIYDLEWDVRCPACKSKAFVAGIQVAEEIVDSTIDDEEAWESVETVYQPEEFSCPTCGLKLEGSLELIIAGLADDHTVVREREMTHEPEYGND